MTDSSGFMEKVRSIAQMGRSELVSELISERENRPVFIGFYPLLRFSFGPLSNEKSPNFGRLFRYVSALVSVVYAMAEGEGFTLCQ